MESSGKACRKRAKEGQGQILGRLQEAEQKTSKSIHLLSLSGFIVTSKIYVLYYSPNSNWLALGGNENSSPRVPPSEQVEVCLFRGLPRDAENNDCVIFNQKIINFLKGSMERLRINWKSGKGGGKEQEGEIRQLKPLRAQRIPENKMLAGGTFKLPPNNSWPTSSLSYHMHMYICTYGVYVCFLLQVLKQSADQMLVILASPSLSLSHSLTCSLTCP